ncbi:MAG TPA: maltose ABC transporter permease MalF [Dictyoglomaceae bacterium]|nr:maltose ABC transporter permease MalF [Dictyoglomaceae bacterium]HPU42773.1 maltose ABC transporter permease MalF [Dictyoglomaceae bacterium]
MNLTKNMFLYLYAGIIGVIGIFFSYILGNIAGDIWGLLFFLVSFLFVVFIIHPKTYPWRYIVPAFTLMLIFMIYPIVYTIQIAYTNYGTGHILTKEQVIEQLEKETFLPENPKNYSYAVYEDDKGNIKLLFKDEEGNIYDIVNKKMTVVEKGEFPLEFEHYKILPQEKKFTKIGTFQNLKIPLEEDIFLQLSDINHFATFRQRYKYIPQEDAIYDFLNNEKLISQKGFFVRPNGEEVIPGFVEYVGWENFLRLFKDERVSKSFLRVFSWTFIWAAVTTLLNFAVGLLLALLMNDKNLKFKGIYRTLLIIPWAIPAFISLLVWVGLLNTEVGVVNRILSSIIGVKIPWFLDTTWARVALFLVNLWLGYPYAMTVCLGALQSIPEELYEAAKVDGASNFHQFKSITLPLLLTAIGPLIVGTFSFNFNNFNVIYLLTGGKPPMSDISTVAGTTDILISYTYKLAFEGGRGQDYGLAATISIIVFIIIAALSIFNFWISGTFEREVKYE